MCFCMSIPMYIHDTHKHAHAHTFTHHMVTEFQMSPFIYVHIHTCIDTSEHDDGGPSNDRISTVRYKRYAACQIFQWFMYFCLRYTFCLHIQHIFRMHLSHICIREKVWFPMQIFLMFYNSDVLDYLVSDIYSHLPA